MKIQFLLIIFILFNTFTYSQNLEKGVFNEEHRMQIINELIKLSQTSINSENTIILNFYIKPETKLNGSCIDYYIKDKSFKKFVKKNDKITQFFITEKMYFYNQKNVIEDKNDEIKKLAFENAELCGNYIIIKTNGEYIRKLGEYRQDEIPKLIKE